MRTDVVVVGGGQAGLAMSRVLSTAGLDHVVLDRGEVAQSWRSERWDTLRLLTPNWMTRLPGWRYDGDDPDGYMNCAEVIAMLQRYREHICAPLLTHAPVQRVTLRADGAFDVGTDSGSWQASAVVVASGACSDPHLPACAIDLPPSIVQMTATEYRNPQQLPDGPVLVVGASASGVQIADEVRGSGREVTIAIGEHVRVPRTYRGRDIHWWMDAIGLLDERHDGVDDIERARRVASLQLIGSPQRRDLDLQALLCAGVRPVGKLMRVSSTIMQFSGGVGHLVANADLKMHRLLERIDDHVDQHDLGDVVGPPARPGRTHLGHVPTDVSVSAIRSVVWATGYRPRLPWLDRRAFDRRGRIDHDGGVGSLPGVFVLGLPFLRRRKSNFIDGVGPDAHELVGHVVAHVRGGTHRDAALSGVERPAEQRRADTLDCLHEWP